MGRRGSGEATDWSLALVRAITTMRDDMGMQNNELCAKAGMSPSYLYARLRGDAPFDTNDIERIAHSLGTHPHEISRLALELTNGSAVEPVVDIERAELSRRLGLLATSPLECGEPFTFDLLSKVLAERDIELAQDEWEDLRSARGQGAVRARVLDGVAAFCGVPADYLLRPGDSAVAEATEAQLDFRDALASTGANAIAARTVGEVSPEALRAIAASLRSIQAG